MNWICYSVVLKKKWDFALFWSGSPLRAAFWGAQEEMRWGKPHGQSLDAAIHKLLVSEMSNRFSSEIALWRIETGLKQMREMGRSVFWCVWVSLCAVTQITEMDYLVLWVQVIKTKNFLFCQSVKKKRMKNACVLQAIIIYLQLVLQTSVYYHMWWVNLPARSITLFCGMNVKFQLSFWLCLHVVVLKLGHRCTFSI